MLACGAWAGEVRVHPFALQTMDGAKVDWRPGVVTMVVSPTAIWAIKVALLMLEGELTVSLN
jgi:hypothetical protein